ncbi:MAG: transglycosylase SLT domain-containing protein [Arcobacteraceae bacterium]|nr:transglycosylase SLT domain-containing protein [Arcobacteraceae bacterium]
MKKLILTIFCYLHLSGAIVSNEFVKSDIDILKDLDIESSYIKDQKFQDYYSNFSNRYERNYADSFNNGEDYIPEISSILKENNVPSVFLYMAMAESNFLLDAKSKRSAMGLWQFMPGTATELGLKKNKYVDERMDFIKSTEAAVKYLTKLHGIFGSWYLAALSYNAGDGRVIEAITRATIDIYCKENDCTNNKTIQGYKKTLNDYERGRAKFRDVNEIYKVVKGWNNYKPTINHLLSEKKGASRQYLPPESRNYIKKIISLAMINNSDTMAKNSTRIVNRGNNSSLVRVDVSGGMLLKNIASLAGVTTDKLKKLNPHLKSNITPPSDKKTQLYIPQSKLVEFNENKKNVKTNTVAKNENENKNVLEDDLDAIESDYVKTYIIKKGDNLFRVAKQYGTTMDKIMKDNNLKSSKVKQGDKIVIKLK